MGAITNFKETTLPKSEITNFLNRIIFMDKQTRSCEEDMYRGDFGDSVISDKYYNYPSKHQSEAKVEQSIDQFEDQVTNCGEKYSLYYSVVDVLGFYAYTPKVDVMRSHGEVTLQNGRTFKNITALKKAVKDDQNKLFPLYVGQLVLNENYQPIGTIMFNKVGRLYKSKPKKLPKKYAIQTKLVKLIYGGLCPY